MAIVIFNNQVPPDPNVNYNGFQLPRDKVQYVPPASDPTNDPGVLSIGGIFLPADTIVFIDGAKNIAKSQILDGVEVTEHINRRATNLEFDIVIREDGAITSAGALPITTPSPFPQDQLVNFWDTVWLPNTVQKIQNTVLNKLGILEIVIENVNVAEVRGSKNIPIRMTAYENVPGLSLILS